MCRCLFTKQENVLKSLFDNTDSSGVHISVEGCTKIRDEIVTFFDSDKVISVELKTPCKRTNSALSSTPNYVERQNKQTELHRHQCSNLIFVLLYYDSIHVFILYELLHLCVYKYYKRLYCLQQLML
jgi:hypothetical protein